MLSSKKTLMTIRWWSLPSGFLDVFTYEKWGSFHQIQLQDLRTFHRFFFDWFLFLNLNPVFLFVQGEGESVPGAGEASGEW